jgi:hypothetical protein
MQELIDRLAKAGRRWGFDVKITGTYNTVTYGFWADGKRYFGCIVNVRSLLFYFRVPLLKVVHDFDQLIGASGLPFEVSPQGEYPVRITDERDCTAIIRFIDARIVPRLGLNPQEDQGSLPIPTADEIGDDDGPDETSKSTELIAAEAEQVAREGYFDPNDVTDGRRRAMRSIAQRRGQPAFRQTLLRIYRGKCAFSDCMVSEVLEAAHIMPYKGVQTNHAQNGLLLRTDLHTLFDLGLLAVDTRDMTIIVAPSLGNSEYAALRGKVITSPSDPAVAPSTVALDQQRERTGLTRRSRRRPTASRA